MNIFLKVRTFFKNSLRILPRKIIKKIKPKLILSLINYNTKKNDGLFDFIEFI